MPCLNLWIFVLQADTIAIKQPDTLFISLFHDLNLTCMDGARCGMSDNKFSIALTVSQCRSPGRFWKLCLRGGCPVAAVSALLSRVTGFTQNTNSTFGCARQHRCLFLFFKFISPKSLLWPRQLQHSRFPTLPSASNCLLCRLLSRQSPQSLGESPLACSWKAVCALRLKRWLKIWLFLQSPQIWAGGVWVRDRAKRIWSGTAFPACGRCPWFYTRGGCIGSRWPCYLCPFHRFKDFSCLTRSFGNRNGLMLRRYFGKRVVERGFGGCCGLFNNNPPTKWPCTN